jgi:hypothetical protein
VAELERPAEERHHCGEVQLALLHDEIAVREHSDNLALLVDDRRCIDVAIEQRPHGLFDPVVRPEREHVRRHDVPHG